VKPAVVLHPHEHEYEAQPGLPEPLPPGERILWQGAPDWRVLAIKAFHARKLAIYFAVLLAIAAAGALDADGAAALRSTLVLGALALVALSIVLALAWLAAGTTMYTITDRRVVMRIGIVLGITLNLPFSRIEGADLRRLPRGHGELPLSLKAPDRIAWFSLWPHARPWQLKRPQPMLRAVADAERVARLLGEAWAAANGRSGASLVVGGAGDETLSLPRHAHRTLATHG
jgi:hypothetical protein